MPEKYILCNLHIKLNDMPQVLKILSESGAGKTRFHYIFIFIIMAFTVMKSAAQDEIPGKLSLDKCIELGLNNNPWFQSSELMMKETETGIEESLSGYYPFLSLNSDAGFHSGDSENQRYDNLSTGVILSYNIFQGYRTKSLYGVSKDNYQASIYQHETNRQDLIFGIIEAYYRTLQSERILRSAEEAVKNSDIHLQFAVAKQKAGMATRSDVLKSEVELSSAEMEKIKAANTLLSNKGSLNKLLGLPSDNKTELLDDLSVLNDVLIQSFDTLKSIAINSRAEIKKHLSLIDAQKKNITIAKSGYYPSLSANANYNYAGPAVSTMQQNWWMGLTLSVPVFKGFSNRARVSREEFALKSLEKDFEYLKQQIINEVWNAWLSVSESVERISTSAKAVESARENLSLAEGEYREGVGSIIQLTDAQTTFVTVEQAYIQALADYKISYAELERTIGR